MANPQAIGSARLALPGSDWPPSNDPGIHVEVDGDMLVYACGFANEGEPVAFALHSVKHFLQGIVHESGAGSWQVHLTSQKAEDNFRTALATIQPYKGNRKGSRKPQHYQAIRDYLCEYWDAIVHVGHEADDGLSIAHYKHQSISPDTAQPDEPHTLILASADKDLRGVRGALLFNWRKDKAPELISDLDAMRNFYTQCLTGDATDHIKGLSLTREEGHYMGRSVGVKNHFVLGLENHADEQEMYRHVLRAYEGRHELLEENYNLLSEPLAKCLDMGPEAALLENARLLHMLEYEEQLWQAPN